MTGIKPELIEKALRLTDWSQHEYRVDSRTWIPRCVCGWTATESYDVEGFDRHITETVLATVADDLRAEGAAHALRDFADRQDSWCAEGRAEQVISRRSMRDALRAQAARIECGGVAHVLYQAAKDTESVSEQAIREAKADAWGEGFDAGHETARAVQPGYPAPPPNPYRQEARDE